MLAFEPKTVRFLWYVIPREGVERLADPNVIKAADFGSGDPERGS